MTTSTTIVIVVTTTAGENTCPNLGRIFQPQVPEWFHAGFIPGFIPISYLTPFWPAISGVAGFLVAYMCLLIFFVMASYGVVFNHSTYRKQD